MISCDLQDFLNKQIGVSGKGVSLIEEAVVPSAGDMQRVANAGDLKEQVKAADKLAATTRSKTDEAAQLLVEVENLKKQGIIPPETTVIGDGSTKPQIEDFNDLKKYSSAERSLPGYEIQNGKFVKSTKPTTKGIISNIIRDGKTIFETTVNNKAVKQVIDSGSKVIGAVPKPIKKVVKEAPIIGSIDDLALLATPFYSKEVSKEQEKIDMTKSISGGLGLASLKIPLLWPPATMMWGIAEMKQWQLDDMNREKFYMERGTTGVQGTNEEGELVTPEWGMAQKKRTGRFKR